MNNLDQFYTKEKLADWLVNHKLFYYIDFSNFDICIEPSAGTGSFIKPIKDNFSSYLFYDIEPKHNEVLKQDFLDEEFKVPIGGDQKCIVIGNPPFGKNASLAVKFFKKCSTFATAIAFIVPKTFSKESVLRKLDPLWHKIYEVETPLYSFYTSESNSYPVPCYFQLWIKTSITRSKNSLDVNDNEFLEFVNFNDREITIRRAGSKAGQLVSVDKDVEGLYYCKLKNDRILPILTTNKYIKKATEVSSKTVGNRSISKKELLDLIFEMYYLH